MVEGLGFRVQGLGLRVQGFAQTAPTQDLQGVGVVLDFRFRA